MNNVTWINREFSNQPQHGWLWVHDHPPELVRRYFLICAICDWFFWHCAINNNQSAASGHYRCDSRRACEFLEYLDELVSAEVDDSGFLTDALWSQLEWSALTLLVRGAVNRHKNTSQACSKLFSWPIGSDEQKATLEDYVCDVLYKRSHIFNEGTYHDSMNWLDIYDMELNSEYRLWVESKQSALFWKIQKKLRLVKRYMTYPFVGEVRRQWRCEASYLGLTQQQALSHWDSLQGYLAQKVTYHQARIFAIETAVDSRFTPRQVQSEAKDMMCVFGIKAIDFFEERIKLFWQDNPHQLQLL
jgi:hypothetical protein